eukprot:TRINITY_DN2056_c0_g1_i4.p1 TRINITY_DN2056_c0_g1~~TRINITY_DN2056_c0_g1_i4.p1  ORF type:complete len:149 (+),score=22.89 TRINITY_DN2056_c0_g1_i4:80-526(+)
MERVKGIESLIADLEKKVILVCYDGTPASTAAFSLAALDLCSKNRKDRLIVCIVGSGEDAKRIKDDADLFISVKHKILGLEEGGCTYECVIKEPTGTKAHRYAEDAVALAKSEKADYVVVGNSGGTKKMGSFCEFVVRKSPCSVVVAR